MECYKKSKQRIKDEIVTSEYQMFTVYLTEEVENEEGDDVEVFDIADATVRQKWEDSELEYSEWAIWKEQK